MANEVVRLKAGFKNLSVFTNLMMSFLGGALFVFIITMYSGRHGVYLYDTGINYNMGWQMYEGRLPYIDFTLPLTPACGMLTELGYKVFGVSYISSVYMAAVLSVLAFVYVLNCLRRITSLFVASFIAVIVISGTLPVIGTLYYNHLAQLFVVSISASLLRNLYLGSEVRLQLYGRRMLFDYLLCVALFFTKFHVGCMYGAFLVAFDVRVLSARFHVKNKQVAYMVGYRLAPCFVLLGLFLAWLKFDLSGIVKNIFQTAHLATYKYSLLASVQSVTHILSMPQLTPFYAGVAIVVLLVLVMSHNRLDWSDLSLFAYAIGILILQEICSLLTAETISIGNGTTLIAVFAVGLAIQRHIKHQASSELPGASESVVYAILLAVLLPAGVMQLNFNLLSIYEMSRKSWNEASGQFPALMLHSHSDLVKANVPFFHDILLSPSQKREIEYCYQLSKQNPERSVFWGPELEMLYPATGRLPILHWPLWFHIGVSVNPKSLPVLSERFQAEKPDVVVLSRHRKFMGALELQSIIEHDYVRLGEASPDEWVEVYARRDVAAEIKTEDRWRMALER